MHCHETEQILNERFDSRGASSPERERALERHLESCAACRSKAAHYQVLYQALQACQPPLSSSSNAMTERILAAHSDQGFRVAPRSPRSRILVVMSLAASLIVGAFIVGRSITPEPTNVAAQGDVVASSDDGSELASALAEASEATWELARVTSGPAARVGREVLGAAALGEPSNTLAEAASSSPTKGVLERVGDRVNAGVRPISGTAIRAFGFLLGGLPEDMSAPPPSRSGA